MNAIAAVFVAICLQTAFPSTIDAPEGHNASWVNNGTGEAGMSADEKMKELRIEMVKFQILSKLNWEQAPPKVEPQSETSKEVIRFLMREDEEKQQRQIRLFDSQERLVIHAIGNGLPCLQSNQSFCKLFRYELSATLNTSSMSIWIYKLTEFPKWVSISLAFSSSDEEKDYDILYYKLNQVGWNKLQLPTFLLSSTWNGSVFYSVEIIGQNIEGRGDRRPYLMATKLFLLSPRRRRDVNCDANESCCLKPLRVNFTEIGFNWVLYPEELEANMCTGKCTMDQTTLRTHYERAMTKVLERDTLLHSTLAECLALCCKPKILEPVRVIYNDTKGIIHDQYIPELSVRSCSCS